MITAVIIVGEDALGSEGPSCIYAMGDEESQSLAGRAESLATVPEEVAFADRLVLVLPGERASTRVLTLPVKGDRALREAAALAFEDILADAVEAYHFGFGPLREDGKRVVTAVPAAWLSGWRETWEAAGLLPSAVTVDHLALPISGQEAVVLFGDGRAMFRNGDGGFTLDAVAASGLLPDLVPTEGLLTVALGADSGAAAGSLSLADERAQASFFQNGLAEETVTLLRGAFARKRDWKGAAKPFMLAASLLLAAGLVFLVAAFIDGIRYERGAADLRAEAASEFQRAYPSVPIRDLRRQATQRARGSDAAPVFLPLSAELAAAMEDMPSIQLLSLRYDEIGELTAVLSFPDTGAMENLRTELEARGLVAREGGNLRRDDGGNYSGQLFVGYGS